MKQLISFSVKHPISILMAVLASVICGCISIRLIPVDFLPQLSDRYLLVTSDFTGIPAEEMRRLVTIPVEDAFSSLKGIKDITSVTRDSLSLIQIELHWGTDAEMALTESREIIDACYETLPTGCSKPDVQIFDPVKEDTLTIAVEPIDGDMEYCRYIADTDFRPRFLRINGVGAVSVTGGEKEQIQVILDKTKTESHRLTLQNVADTLSSTNFEYPAGTLREGEKEIVFKTSGLYKNIEDISATPLQYNDGGMLRISDIGTVKEGREDKKTFFLYNGKECVRLGIHKKNDASPLSVSSSIRSEITVLQSLYGTNYRFEIVNDQSAQIKNSLFMLIISAAAGIVITMIILLFFFRSGKMAFIVSGIIPLCIVFSVLVLTISGKSINILSLSGIAVGIGMVIDPGTVVLENIQNIRRKFRGTELQECIIQGTSEVSMSSAGSSLTTIIVFLPFFFLHGLLGELFGDMAVAVIASVSVSCLLSLTYIPALYFLMTNKDRNVPTGMSISRLEQKYSEKLAVVIKKRWVIPLILSLCVGMGTAAIFFLKIELLPKTYSNVISGDIQFPDGITVQKMQNDAEYIYKTLQNNNFISGVQISGGIDNNDYKILSDPAQRKEMIHFSCITTDRKRAEENLTSLFNSTTLKFTINKEQDLLSQLLAVDSDSYIVSGTTPEEVREKAIALTKKTSCIEPYDIITEQVFTPDRAACARFSISALYTAQLAYNTLEGVRASSFYRKGREIPVYIKFSGTENSDTSALADTAVLLENSYIPLRTLGSIHTAQNEKILYRYNRKDAKHITPPFTSESEVRNNSISLREMQLSELFGNASLLLVVILLLLYCIMGAQFESFSIPLYMIISLPPAFSGAFIFLILFHQTININSVIALVVLFGTAVNNAILLYESCSLQSVICDETIINACTKKLRAILITTTTTICALIPFAIDPLHKNSQSSMAVAIIGGLLLSLIIVLFVLPPVLSTALKRRSKK